MPAGLNSLQIAQHWLLFIYLFILITWKGKNFDTCCKFSLPLWWVEYGHTHICEVFSCGKKNFPRNSFCSCWLNECGDEPHHLRQVFLVLLCRWFNPFGTSLWSSYIDECVFNKWQFPYGISRYTRGRFTWDPKSRVTWGWFVQSQALKNMEVGIYHFEYTRYQVQSPKHGVDANMTTFIGGDALYLQWELGQSTQVHGFICIEIIKT